MVLYLTSDPGGNRIEKKGVRVAAPFTEAYGFLKNFSTDLAALHTPPYQGLIMASDPDNHGQNQGMLGIFREAFVLSEIPMHLTLCETGTEDYVNRLNDYDFILLSGGHVPTENAFFRRIHLAEKLQGFRGVVMGISAGTMNAAREVYVMPELPGESTDPVFRRFLPGLGLTEYQIIPHVQWLKTQTLDGRNVMDIAKDDVPGHVFTLLEDGAYIRVTEECTEEYGPITELREDDE